MGSYKCLKEKKSTKKKRLTKPNVYYRGIAAFYIANRKEPRKFAPWNLRGSGIPYFQGLGPI